MKSHFHLASVLSILALITSSGSLQGPPRDHQAAPPRDEVGGGSQVETTFKRLDRNSDGFVTESEASTLWDRIKDGDTNGDKRLTLEEARNRFGGGQRQ